MLSSKQRAALAKGRARLKHASKATRRCWAQKAALTRQMQRTVSPAGVDVRAVYPSMRAGVPYDTSVETLLPLQPRTGPDYVDMGAMNPCSSLSERPKGWSDAYYAAALIESVLINNPRFGFTEKPSSVVERESRRLASKMGLSKAIEFYNQEYFTHEMNPSWLMHRDRRSGTFTGSPYGRVIRAKESNPVDPALAADIGRDVSALVRGHLEQGTNPLKWSTAAGGTGAPPDKHSYDARAMSGTYYIWPFTGRYGKFLGYSVKFADTGAVLGGGLWHELGVARSPNDAKAYANAHALKHGIMPNIVKGNPVTTGAESMELMANPELLTVGLNPRRKRRNPKYKVRYRHRNPKGKRKSGSKRRTSRPKHGRTISYRGKRYYFVSLMHKFGKGKARTIWHRRMRSKARKHCGRVCTRKYLPRGK